MWRYAEDLEPLMAIGEELKAEDLSATGDAMVDGDVPAGEAEGVLEEDEA